MSLRELGGAQFIPKEDGSLGNFIDNFHELNGYAPATWLKINFGACERCKNRLTMEDNPVMASRGDAKFLMHGHCAEMEKNAKLGYVYPGIS